MIVPASKAGLIIGAQGDTLRRIEKQAQVRMQFDQAWAGGEHERRIVITGFPEDIEEARRLIMEKIEDRPRDRDRAHEQNTTVQYLVPSVKVGLLIGRGGETIKELQDRSGVRINVNPEETTDRTTGERPISLSGDPEGIKIAKSLINDILFGGPPGSSLGGRPTLVIQIPESAVGSVMGKRADILKSIIAASGAKIFIEHSNIPGTRSREVQLSGSAECCAYAAQLIQERVTAQLQGGPYYPGQPPPLGPDSQSQQQSDQGGVIYQAPGDFSTYDYSQYYANQPQAAGAGATMDPAAMAAYYAQYYGNAAGGAYYDPNAYDPAAPN